MSQKSPKFEQGPAVRWSAINWVNFKIRPILFSIFTLTFASQAHASSSELCPHIKVTDGKFHLNKNEKIIVCGDDRSDGWKQVPFDQAQTELRSLLQKDGYNSPEFTIEGDDLLIKMGSPTRIKEWELQGNTSAIEKRKKRKVLGEKLTPAKLDEIERWIESELKYQGYACPKIESKAQVWDASVESRYESGPKLRIKTLNREGMANLDAEAFKRFEPFEEGDLYNNRKLQITTNRLLTDGLAQSSYFTQNCTPDGVELTHHMDLGEPRILRVGFGASSEEFPFLDAWYKNTRIDGRASSYWLNLHASPLTQSLEGSSQLYILPFTRRTFLGPRFRVARDIEDAYESLSGKTGIDIGRLWDWNEERFEFRAGPTANYVNTIRGFGPDDVSYLTVEGNLNVMNNDYELTGTQQFSGYQASLQYQGQREGLGSPLNADMWTLRAKNLWDIGELSPPYLVLGTRIETNVTTSDAIGRSTDREILPTEYRIFLGGEQNLRGFKRQTINNQGLGYLTSAYLGTDLRLVEELPWNLEPLLLWDVAIAGDVPWHLEGPLFQSYGFGMRWRSPLGPIRVTAARGVISNSNAATESVPQEWVFLFSFGREF
jgi:outer membrane translocation and assembly module TamA